MKQIAFLIAFACSTFHGFGQVVWNKKLPASDALPRFSELNFTDGSYWVTTDNSLTQINETGTITGQASSSIGFEFFWIWGSKITPGASAMPYFILARLTALAPDNGYTLAHYKPGFGIVNQVVFTDSLSSVTQSRAPVFVAVDNSTLLVFGHKVIRKIQHNASGAISEAWTKLLSFKTNDAVWTGSQAIFCDALGNFKALDAAGNLLWEKTQPFSSKSIKLVPDGIIGCGNAASGEGLVFKLDFNGNLLWSKILAEPKINDLVLVSDGGILLTGETTTSDWLVLKTDGLGNPVWSRSYEKGRGWEIEQSSDGGAVVLWHLSSGHYRIKLAKIDALGNTVPEDTELSPIVERTLRTSGAKAIQYPVEGLFFDGSSSRLHIPADSNTSPIYTNSPWIGGLDASGNLHIAATTYGSTPADYRAGLASSPAKDFERVWAVSREEIAQIRRDFGEDGNLDTPPPFDLLSWPAKGNPHFTQNLDFSLVTTNPDSLPAPFIDHNGDGIYNVLDGDYPKLLGDRMLWWARTDQTIHEETNGAPLSVDVLFTLYGYDCPQNGGISQSVFADYQFINRSGADYHDVYMGFFTDFDLGCSDDDHLGTLPEANSVYVYNQDAVDGQPGTSCAAGVSTYGENIPVESITMLNRSMDYATNSNRTGAPSSLNNPFEYYSYLQGLVCNGQLPTVGGTGCNPGSTDFTNFVFYDNPASPGGWSMCSANLSPGDRRSLASHGPFNLSAQDTFSIRLAFIFHPDIPHPCPDVDGFVKPTILQIQQWYDEGTLDAHLDLGGVLVLAPGQSLLLNATQSNPATTYAWSTGQNTPSIIVNQTGEYTVTVSPATGCAYSETVLVRSASGTGNPILPTWQLLPNPASDVITILFDGGETSLTALLRNAQGQIVASKSNDGDRLEIPVTNLPAGLYWAELRQNGLFMGSRKVAVVR